MIFCTSECSPNFFLYCITTDPFRKGFCQKKEQVMVGCDAHAPEAPDVVPLLRETQAYAAPASKGRILCPASSEALYFAEKSAILKLSEGIL